MISITACKSAPLAVEVNPLDILDSESSFYMAIPRKADPELIKRVVQNNIDGLSDSNAQLLTDRINKVYCGLNRTRKSTTIQATIDASIPQKYVSKVLNKKNRGGINFCLFFLFLLKQSNISNRRIRK